MITVLIVVGGGQDVQNLGGGHASVEVLLAHGLEDALEKLARNRRIDAILLLAGRADGEIVRAIRDDNPAHPPMYRPAGQQALEGVSILPAREAADLIDLMRRELDG